MLGAAMGLSSIGATEHLAGELAFFAVPAEEFIDGEERQHRKERGEIEFLLGKPELVAKGHFDDIDRGIAAHRPGTAPNRPSVRSHGAPG